MEMKKNIGKRRRETSEYDSAWKDVIEEHFEAFLEFFFPDIHKDIDFSKGYDFLSKELRKIAPDGKVGKRYADVLVKVHLKDGSEKCICVFIHIEVQGTKDPHFMVRIFVYHYRIFDKYHDQGVEVISLAILTDEDESYRPDEYNTKRWGFEHRMKIPMVKIIDYKNNKELKDKLETSLNPMAMVVKVQLKSYEMKKADNDRKSIIKKELIRECYKQGYEKGQIRSLLRFIDWIIRLPEGLQNKLTQEINKIEEEYKMPYVTSWERSGLKKGREQGLKEGVKKGKLETAKRMLNDDLSIETITKYTGLTEVEIKALMN